MTNNGVLDRAPLLPLPPIRYPLESGETPHQRLAVARKACRRLEGLVGHGGQRRIGCPRTRDSCAAEFSTCPLSSCCSYQAAGSALYSLYRPSSDFSGQQVSFATTNRLV